MRDDDLGLAGLIREGASGSPEPLGGSGRAAPDRNLSLELVRVTEAAALAAARLMGRGEEDAAEEAAIRAMRLLMDTIPMDGVVVIGEGDKDRAAVLYTGEHMGRGDGPAVDIAVDAVDGRRLAARGMNGALSAAALAERGSMFDPGPSYMDKIAVGADAAGVIDIAVPVAETSAGSPPPPAADFRSHGRGPRPAAPCGPDRRDPGCGGPGPAHPGR